MGLLLNSLNEILSKYFGLTTANKHNIRQEFNRRLLKEGSEFLWSIKFLGNEKVMNYFSRGIILDDKKLKKSEIIRREREQYLDALNSLHLIVEQIEVITKEMIFMRTTILTRIASQIQKVISILGAMGTSAVSIFYRFSR